MQAKRCKDCRVGFFAAWAAMCVAVFLTTTGTPLTGAEPQSQTTRNSTVAATATLEAAVQRLGSDKSKERAEAAEFLAAQGAATVPALEEGIASPYPAIRFSALELLLKLWDSRDADTYYAAFHAVRRLRMAAGVRDPAGVAAAIDAHQRRRADDAMVFLRDSGAILGFGGGQLLSVEVDQRVERHSTEGFGDDVLYAVRSIPGVRRVSLEDRTSVSLNALRGMRFSNTGVSVRSNNRELSAREIAIAEVACNLWYAHYSGDLKRRELLKAKAAFEGLEKSGHKITYHVGHIPPVDEWPWEKESPGLAPPPLGPVTLPPRDAKSFLECNRGEHGAGSFTLWGAMCVVDGQQAEALAQVAGLEVIRLTSCMLDARARRKLSSLRFLEDASFLESNLDDDDLARLAKLPLLRRLSVSGSMLITDAGVAHLAKMQTLGILNLSGTRITDETLDILLAAPHLNELWVRNTKVSKQAIAEFKRQRPEVEVAHDYE